MENGFIFFGHLNLARQLNLSGDENNPPLFDMLALLFTNKVHSQKTPADFGNTVFWCFQHNRMDSLFKLIPTLQDLSGFAKEMGIVEGSAAYQSFVEQVSPGNQKF